MQPVTYTPVIVIGVIGESCVQSRLRKVFVVILLAFVVHQLRAWEMSYQKPFEMSVLHTIQSFKITVANLPGELRLWLLSTLHYFGSKFLGLIVTAAIRILRMGHEWLYTILAVFASHVYEARWVLLLNVADIFALLTYLAPKGILRITSAKVKDHLSMAHESSLKMFGRRGWMRDMQ